MIFPFVEAKIATIKREDAEPRTTVLVRLYRVDDGGLDANGWQVYTRTLRRQRQVKHIGLIATDAQIVTTVRARVLAWLDELSITIPKDRLVCSL